MELWQIKAAEKMSYLLSEHLTTNKIELSGSVLNPTELDKFSDVDMYIYMPTNTPINFDTLLNVLTEQFGPPFGFEIHCQNDRDVLRICFEDGQRFDLVFIYTGEKEGKAQISVFSDAIGKLMNQYWFISVMVLVKLGRNDNLIAAHLLLELCQTVIGIQMLIRDKKKNTNFHRFGDSEKMLMLWHLIGFSSAMSLSDDCLYQECDLIYSVLLLIARHMDKVSAEAVDNYTDKIDILRDLCNYFHPRYYKHYNKDNH